MAEAFLYIGEIGDEEYLEYLEKSIPKAEGKITRKEAKEAAKKHYPDLPPNGRWVTIRGNHVYIADGKVVAGVLPWMNKKGELKTKKATKAHLKAFQEHVDKKASKEAEKAKEEKPASKKKKASSEEASAKTTKKTATKKTATKKTAAAGKKSAEFEEAAPTKTVKKTASKKKKADAAPVEEAPKATKKASKKAKASEEAKETKTTKTKKTTAKKTATKKTAKAAAEKTESKASKKTTKRTTKAKAESAHTPGSKEYWNDIVAKRTLSNEEIQRIMESNLSDKDKKKILSEDKKRRKEELASVEKERSERKAKEQKLAKKKQEEEQAALAKRKAEEKEMKVKKVAAAGSKEKMKAPDMKRVEIAPNTSEEHKKVQARENEAIKEGHAEPEGKYAKLLQKMNKEWGNHSEIQKLLGSKKRALGDVKRLAREFTEKYIPVADREAEKAYYRLGRAPKPEDFARLYQDPKAGKQGRAITQYHENALNAKKELTHASGFYGDLQQSARSALFSTIHNVLSGAEKPKGDIAPHVITRIRDQLKNNMYELMNDIHAPERMRPLFGEVERAKYELAKELGRMPTDKELANHLMENSKRFREAPVVAAPYWDDKKQDWVFTNKQETDPVKRLKLIQQAMSRQQSTSSDKNVGKEGEKEVTLGETKADENLTPEERVERAERRNELKTAIPQALKEMGLDDAEREIFMLRHADEKPMQYKEIAEHLKKNKPHIARGGEKWVWSKYNSAMKKIAAARDEEHPNHAAFKRLLALKSLFMQDVLRQMYMIDLVKSLRAWGIDHTVLEERFVRIQEADDYVSLRKSLAPYESIGSLAYTEDGRLHARIVELALPERNELYKSFNYFTKDLKKSMFPHRGSSNAAINEKASQYVKANKHKYHALADQQMARIREKRSKGGQLTWSEQLQLEKGGVWITWGGKKILINADNGDIMYDSRNEAHREEYNQGASEDQIEFHHEKEALAEHEEKREQALREEWESIKNGKAYKKDPEKEKERFMKKNRGVHIDEEGNLHFTPDTEVNEQNAHAIDHGIHAFQKQMEEMRNAWARKEGNKIAKDTIKGRMLDTLSHRMSKIYADLNEEEREKMDNMSPEERRKFFGERILNTEGVKETLEKYKNGELSEEDVANELKKHGISALNHKDTLKKVYKALKNGASDEEIADILGGGEMTRTREEATKGLLPEGKFMIGNPLTGKTMVVNIRGGFEGGRAGKGGKYTSIVAEAFDPEGGTHEIINSWGQLGKALGYTGKDAQKLKEILVQKANTDPDKPFMKMISDEEYNKYRSKTKLGMQESMKHKNFRLVDEKKDKNGNVIGRTFAQDMEDGTTNVIEVDKDGYIKDPIMARLIRQKKAIKNGDDLHEVLKDAVGNTAWVTLHAGSDIHIGDALGHHVKLMYDGMGAPRVVGGVYDGYRFIDQNDIPKGATDPVTGEPVKALFKNGRLVDRRFTTVNEVPMEVGNAVMYKDGDGKWKKGRIHSEVEGGFKVTDGKGNLVGVFSKDELRNAKEHGRTLSESGQAVVRLAKDGTHRFNVAEMFKNPHEGKEKLSASEKRQVRKLEKTKELFAQALRKAGINTHAFDRDGNLRDQIELSDSAMNRLKKVLGKSRAGRELLNHVNSVYKNELEIHVPEHLRKQVEAEGVRVLKDGTARISVGKFEQLRDSLGGLSLDHKARDFLKEHFERKDRRPKSPEELQKTYQPSAVNENTAFGKHYKSLFKADSALMEPGKGLYGTQLEGVAHLRERGRAIAGHGMGLGKTITGVVAHAHYKADKLAKGEQPKKTLIVAPAGIRSDWGKEIAKHTNMKGLYIGSGLAKRDANGKIMKDKETGRNLWGQDGTEQEAVHIRHFLKNMNKIGSEDHDFHIVSYDTFMRNRDAFANSGLYDNILIDEIHAFKNQKGKRGQSLAETTDKFQNVWGLSGTPMENDARELWALIDTVTGGRHELGSRKEFMDNFMIKDRSGKVVGIKPDKAKELGSILANLVQFRKGEDVTYNDGSKIKFPQLVGKVTEDNPNPRHDFIADLVDHSRDHQTTDYYGTKHSVFDYEKGSKTVDSKNGEPYEVETFKPKNLSDRQKAFYDEYNRLQAKHLPESKLKELETAAVTGYEDEKKGSKNYLTAMQKLQKYLNAPLAAKMYVPGGTAMESELTDAQDPTAKEKKGGGLQEYNPETGEGHYVIDEHGHKRYFESDGKGGYLKNEDGSPKLLPPLHHNNPKAEYLKDRISKYLDTLAHENAERRKQGKPEIMPKVVVKSGYTTFGTDIVENVFRDLQREHPELLRWAEKVKQQHGKEMGFGRFTGDADDREDTKVGFRGNKDDYANNQGWLWATTVSPAGKEGVDFGNAHYLLHYDQDWNPQRMAQFTARGRRSDSWKAHAALGRDNSIRVESLHMPGTIEDFLFNAEDTKMGNIRQIEQRTREEEKAPRYGDSAPGSATHRGFIRRKKKTKKLVLNADGAAATSKALKLVVLL